MCCPALVLKMKFCSVRCREPYREPHLPLPDVAKPRPHRFETGCELHCASCRGTASRTIDGIGVIDDVTQFRSFRSRLPVRIAEPLVPDTSFPGAC